MKITNVAIKYRTSIVVLTVLLTFGGLMSYITIPKESFPSIEIPNIVVTTIYPGASPDDIESLLTKPIEQEIQGINGIKEIRSTSVEGVSTVIVEFDPDVSMDEAFQKVRDKVDVAKAELPGDVEEPLVNEIDLQAFPIMNINLAAPYSLARLKEVAEDLAEEIEGIPSVLEVPIVGGLEREVQVNVDLNALQGYNLTFDDIISTIRQENANIPGGSMDVGRLNYLVRIDGEFEDPEEEIERLVIESPDGMPIYIRDVADVVFGYKDRSSYARLRVLKVEKDNQLIILPDEETATLAVVTLNVKKRSGVNILETSAAVEAVLAQLSKLSTPVTEDEDYLQTSRYIQHIGAYLKHYPKDRFLVITTEQLAADPAATLAAVHSHLGVYPVDPPEDVGRRNVTGDRRVDSEMSLRLKANPAYWRAPNRSWQLRNVHERVFSRKARVPSTQLRREVEKSLHNDLEKDTEALEVFLGRNLTEWGR
ncbi:MAG: efflux RND transporter permease subunit [Bacteroidetes bacterium]|nr:efflux RND transporter permease subunit [Bacteroidota bacterium]